MALLSGLKGRKTRVGERMITAFGTPYLVTLADAMKASLIIQFTWTVFWCLCGLFGRERGC